MIQFLFIPAFFGLSTEVYIIYFLIGLTTFFLWRHLFRRYIRNEGIRKIATWAATLFGIPFIYAGLIAALLFGITYEHSLDFNQLKWMKDREKRYQMANDLIESKILIGKDTSQVKQILGIANSVNTDGEWVYTMGMGGGGLGFMFHNLIIKFDNHKVLAVEHAKIPD
ncbi:hypothetical protein [Daejeonella oryzae]|uniref:hypothetical protein n=1 Tax=Daejeonella oryzae TaxID=1122943 RepID=UPI00040AD7E3|nr:hypothetical protein [Daejeonella oryzae]